MTQSLNMVVIGLSNMADSDMFRLMNMFSNNSIPIPPRNAIAVIVENLYDNLSRTFVVSVRDQKLTTSLLDCSYTQQYTETFQTCVDRFIYDCWSNGLQVGLGEASEFVQQAELSFINEICSFIPDIDESALVIKNTYYKAGFNFFLLIEHFP